ncbi:helix-turn-helix domain-containing protein [Bacillus salipaludis]|nr:helix-turn-helix transcriptional regulator [Bacillus salipaludis]
MFGIGRRGSKFGKFLEKHRISQTELANSSGVSNSTISRLASGNAFKPSEKNASKLIKALKKVDSNVGYDDFWSM